MPFKQPLGERDAANRTAPTFIRPLGDKRAVVGEKIVLECQLEGHPDPAVKWLKDGHNVSLCPDYQIEENGMTHRLIIPQVQAADNGRFTAQAANSAGIKQSTCILIVGPAPTPVPGAKSAIASPAPPQTPVGPSAPIFLKDLRHQPLKPGASVTFEARVIAVPQPTIQWLKNGKELQNYRARLEHDTRSGIVSLTIPQMFNDDVGEYTIKANNVHGEAISVAQLLPREQYDRWFSNEQTRLTKDRKQGVLSQAMRPSSVAQKQMAKQGYDTDQGSVDLHWAVSESETEPELSALDAKGSPGTKPIVRTPLRGLRLTEGTDAILQANIVGNPKPRIQWFFNNKPYQVSGPRIQMTYKGSLAVLKISMITPDEAGEYTIVSENRFGKVESSARIEVYPLSVPEDRQRREAAEQQQQKHQQQIREQQERERQAQYEATLARERQERASKEAENRRIREEQDRLRALFEREKAERERLEEERRLLEQEKLLRQQQHQQLFEQQRQQEEHLRRLQKQRENQQQQQFSQQHQHQHNWQDLVSRPQYIQEEPHYAQIRHAPSHQQLYEQHRRQQQQQPRYQQREQQLFEPTNHFNQYQQHIHEQHQTMPVFRPMVQQQQNQANGGVKAANGSAGNGTVANGSTQQQPHRGHEHGAALVAARPPQVLVHPQSVAAKAWETVTFSAKVVGHPTPSLTWQKADGAAIQNGGKYRKSRRDPMVAAN
ncbi:unnamed protein product [Caenorhabditis angaria]|uniref:Ig-like domain-containing protein n=1 Tax=Caenorhabditis angaria TaxID=860376 RepID=A0A9P1IW80_9PELO|nr:unnamed protein product [Caenorhabditis angaria]